MYLAGKVRPQIETYCPLITFVKQLITAKYGKKIDCCNATQQLTLASCPAGSAIERVTLSFITDLFCKKPHNLPLTIGNMWWTINIFITGAWRYIRVASVWQVQRRVFGYLL